jgi:hypothetical protein
MTILLRLVRVSAANISNYLETNLHSDREYRFLLHRVILLRVSIIFNLIRVINYAIL